MRHIRHFLLVLMLMCGFTASAENNYGLADSIQGGVILHCFGWTYDQIIENLENIAEAGFTAVQTLPVQVIDGGSYEDWEDLYKYPIGLSLSYKGSTEIEFSDDPDEGDYYEGSFYPLGSPDDLKTLCDSAHSFGILVIAEINANGLYYKDDEEEDLIQASLKGDTCWHDLNSAINGSDRYSITYNKINELRDLASENEYVQQCVIDFLKELDSIGVDGIRWYQARYISLPSEKFDGINGTSNFWPAVTTNSGLDLYNYGVINGSPSSNPSDDSLMVEYVKYVSITDDEYGIKVIQGFASGTVVTDYGNWASSDYEISPSRIVYIPESSDTYYMDSEDTDYTGDLSQNIADRAWAVLASRNDATALYFARPLEDEFKIGDDVNDHFTSSEVAQVNIFHNICNGEPDYYSANDSVISVCRESGAVLVLVEDSNKTVTATNGGGYTTAGTYTDKLSGNTFTVTDYYITGTIGSTGIAVLYSDSALLPRIILDPDGGEFPDELTVTANLNTIATSGTLQVGDGEVQTITDRTTVTIGKDMSLGDSVTIYWTATDGTNTRSGSSTYIKIFKTINIYVKTLSNDTLKKPNIYSWIDGTPAIEKSGTWPGESMTGSYYIGKDHYFSTKFDSVSYINIIINSDYNGSNQTTNITGIDEDAFIYYVDSTETDSTTYASYEILTPPAFLPDPSIENQPLYVYLVNNAYYDSLTVSIWDNDNNSFTGENGDELTHLVSTYDDYGIYYDVYKWNYDDSLTSTPTSLTFTGSNGNKSMTTDTLKFYNGGWYSNAETWFGSQGKVFRTLQVIYDEETANGYYTNTDTLIFSSSEMLSMYTTLVREFYDSSWNTICLPFDVSPDTLTYIFGDNTIIAEFDTVIGTTLHFTEMKKDEDSIKAGVPYLIKPSATVTNPIFYKTAMNSTLATSVEKQNAEGDKYKFTGTYSPYALDTLTDMFLAKNADLLHPTPTNNKIKGLRAYITLPDSSTTAAAVSFEPLISTGINRVDTDDDNDADADIYNISGQKVNSDISTLPQGIYITRGRKFIIK